MQNKIIISLILPILLSACAASYRPYKNYQGYVVLAAGENNYRIEYFSKSQKMAKALWENTAQLLCPAGYFKTYGQDYTIHGSLKTPIAGQMVDIGKQDFLYYGEVTCEGAISEDVRLTDSPWREVNKHTKSLKPVSNAYIAQTLKIPLYDLNALAHLLSKKSRNAIIKHRGKPREQVERDGRLFSSWLIGGDSWFPNQLVLVEENNCLKLVIVIPATTSIVAEVLSRSKKLMQIPQSFLLQGFSDRISIDQRHVNKWTLFIVIEQIA